MRKKSIETLDRPHIASEDLVAAYQAMAADEDREAEAHEWAEATARDVADGWVASRSGAVTMGLTSSIPTEPAS